MSRYASFILGVSVALLACLGLVMLASTSAWVRGVEEPYFYLRRQAIMVGIGTVLALFTYRVDHALLRRYWPWILGAACVLLTACYVPGLRVAVNGAYRWIHVPLVGQFQPSEPARVACMLALAGWFGRWQTETRSFWRGFVLPGMILAVPICLIMFEKNMGEATDIALATLVVMFCIGVRWFYLLPTAGLAGAALVWIVRHNENRMARIEAWQHLDDPAQHIGKGMQQWRSLLAFGNGGPTGLGLGNSAEKLGFLPEFHTDFIFPVIGEELGLVFTLGVVLCYVLIAVSGISIAVQANTVFARCLAIGLTSALVIPAMTNIAVVTALLPNDGKPLPFVSYGGSSVIFALAATGLLMGIHRGARVESPVEIQLARQARFAVRL
jgi:cell division protein FtsW